MENIITVENLYKYYETYSRGNSFYETVKNIFHRDMQKVAAVNDISFTIPTGQIVGLLGPNGAGKSTTIKILTGVLFPSSGEVDVMGYVPWKQRKRYVANIGAVFGQKSQLIWDIPPVDSFYMNKEIYGISKGDFNNSLDYMAEIFHIEDIMKKPTRNLSLGERMKCEFVMAMLHNPPVVFLDEPTIGLDIIAKDTIREFIVQMNKKGTTFILTTHDLEDVERLAHSVIIINHGKIVFSDSLTALKNHLGAVKTAHVVMKSPLRPIAMAGVTVTKEISENEAVFAIDTALTGINAFIAELYAIGELADISIKEPAIENVIKSLY